ncbi:MAG: alpha/beta hydrolase [Kiritimatiellaceae bacterium]|nr:alpha/beta hydrolase [Kiritimatiellaceae bacterium]
MIVKILFFAAAAVLVSRGEGSPDKIVPYKKVGDAELTLHIFNPPGHQASDKTPTIVFFFGGGWVSGEPSMFYKQSAYLASRGMVAICADYRTKGTYQTTPQECVKDGKSAMRWVRAHAAELGIDPQMIAAGGGSAGGQVAAAAALTKGFNETSDDLSVSCRPDALVLFNPVFDNGPGSYGHGTVKEYWEGFSPMNNIATGAPPTLVMLGTADQLVPVSTAEKYKMLMEQVGSRCDLKLYEGAKHAFFNSGKAFESTLLEADKFLISLGYLKGEPTLKN